MKRRGEASGRGGLGARAAGVTVGVVMAGAALALVAVMGAASPARAADGEAGGAGRAEWLRQTLLAQHRELLARDPQAVAGKFARMARNTFSLLRGTASLLPAAPSRFVTPAAARVAVMGDPHLENVGTYLTPRGERVVDFNDFDLAGYGSYVEDLRRLALGLWIAADMADLPRKQRKRVVEAVAEGYAAEIKGLARGGRPVSLRVETAFGGDIGPLLANADDEAGVGGVAGAGPSAEERALVKELLERYPATLVAPAKVARTSFAVKSIVRLHAGIGSYPLLRYRVVVEGPGPGPADDWTLELKETRDRKAAALLAIQRQFQEFPDDDPLLGWAASGGREFRVRQVSVRQRRLSVERLVKELKSPRWGKKDLRALGFEVGRLLGRGHARTRTEAGAPGLAAIAGAIGDGEGLRDETIEYAGRTAPVIEADLDHLRALLRRHGPLLGLRAGAAP